MAATRTTQPTEAVPFDAHGIDPIPPSGRDSTPWEQFWIWTGAIAPINWLLGALDVTLGLSLVETLVVIALATRSTARCSASST